MPNCTNEPIELGRVGRRVVEAALDGGKIVSDGGVLRLRQVDQRIGLSKSIARVFDDRRRRASVAQRIYGLWRDWEDVCGHHVLRRDLAMQTAVTGAGRHVRQGRKRGGTRVKKRPHGAQRPLPGHFSPTV